MCRRRSYCAIPLKPDALPRIGNGLSQSLYGEHPRYGGHNEVWEYLACQADEGPLFMDSRKYISENSSRTTYDGSIDGPDISPFRVEPLTDFSRAEARRAMDAALAQVAPQLGRTYLPLLNGQAVHTAATFDSVNPSHSKQIVGRCGRASAEQAKEAVAIAAAAFPAWRDTEAAKRADYLFAAARVMRRRRFELAAWQVYECGKPRREADADVAESIDYCEFYGREMLRLARPRRRDVPGEENTYFY
jgi:hypothetical protein